ncbi:MAG: MFS transporter [Porphyromonadaceae bacterium]|nr:MAG: MFS transporter [Porphyromonadaceae bacterium]
MITQKNNKTLFSQNFIHLTISVFLISTAFYFLMPTLPVYLEEVLHAGKQEVGLIIGTYTLAALLVRPISGYALDTLGRKWIFLTTLSLFSALFLIYPFAVTLLPLLILRFLHGLNWGASTTAGFTLVVDLVPVEKRGRGISYFGLSFTVAMSIGPVIGLKVMGENHFTALFLVAGGVSVLGILMASLVKYPAFKRPENPVFSWKMLIARQSVPVALNMLILAASYGGVLTFITLYAKENDLNSYTGWFFTITAIGTALTRVFSGSLFDRYGPTWISVFGMIAVSGGLLLLAHAPVLSFFLISGFVIGVGFGVIFPTLQTMANNVVTRDRRGAANSTFLTGLDLGIGLGSVLTGVLSEPLGLAWTYNSAALLAFSGLVFFLVVSLPHYMKFKQDQ